MATKFTPLHDRILVRRVEEAATTRGGILIPDSAKDKPQEGEVISVGKGKSNEDGKLHYSQTRRCGRLRRCLVSGPGWLPAPPLFWSQDTFARGSR